MRTAGFVVMGAAFASCLGCLYVELGEPVFLGLSVASAVLVALRLREVWPSRDDPDEPELGPAVAPGHTWTEDPAPPAPLEQTASEDPDLVQNAATAADRPRTGPAPTSPSARFVDNEAPTRERKAS